MAKSSMRRFRERISEAPSNRLVRALRRELSEDVRRTVEDVLCQRLLDAVIPILVRHHQLTPSDAEELALDAVLVLISHPERYQPSRGASVETFAKRIAVCDAINRQRKAERRGVQLVPLSEVAGAELCSSTGYGGMDERVHPEAGTGRSTNDRFADAYRSLSPQVQQVLVLRAEGVDYQDIATYTDMTSGAAMTAFSRAKRRLAESLR